MVILQIFHIQIPQQRADIALIKNNAKVGADIAVEFQKLKNANNARNSFNIGASKSLGTRQFHTACNLQLKRPSPNGDGSSFVEGKYSGNPVVVIGGANVDRTFRVLEDRVKVSLKY